MAVNPFVPIECAGAGSTVVVACLPKGAPVLFVLLPLFITVVMAYSTWKILTWSPILIPSTVPREWVEAYWNELDS